MAFSSHALSPGDNSLVSARRAETARQGFFVRFLARMQEARLRQAERQVARYLHLAGGMSDANEREIERRFLANEL
jgi:hypothetical protein